MVSLDFDGDVIVETIGASKDAVRNWMHPCQLDAGRLKPRPIKVGDRVRFSDEHQPYWFPDVSALVVAVSGGRAWIQADNGANAVPELSHLVKV